MLIQFHEVNEYFWQILFRYSNAWILDLKSKFNVALYTIFELIVSFHIDVVNAQFNGILTGILDILNFKQNHSNYNFLTLICKFDCIW